MASSYEVFSEAYAGIQDSYYRNAFPAFKVFIYGKEITHDVLTVRINQAGGSVERTPSTVNITLANKGEKYTINHEDMFWIGNARTKMSDPLYSKAQNLQGSYNPGNVPFDYSNPYLGYVKLTDSGRLDSGNRTTIDPLLATKFPTLTESQMLELAGRLAESTNEEKVYTLQALAYGTTGNAGFFNLTTDEALALSASIQNSVAGLRNSKDWLQNLEDDSLTDNIVQVNIKREVVNSKIREFSPVSKRANTISASSDKKSDAGIVYIHSQYGSNSDKIFRYPYQEGDCIFGFNDPIRVAFRDPFDPRIWYWMFTGFVDQWTEDTSSDLDSTITILGTDVTKTSRYAVSNVNPGLSDPNSKDLINLLGENNQQSNIQTTANEFARLSLYEILEIVFFGSESILGNSTNLLGTARARQAYFDEISDFTYYLDKDLTQAEKNEAISQLLIQRFGYSYDQIFSGQLSSAGGTTLDADYYTEILKQEPAALNKQLSGGVSSAENAAATLKWLGVSHPGGASFNRKDDRQGVHFYVFGDSPSLTEVTLGARGISLYDWNELIHHRVRLEDVFTMAKTGSAPESQPTSITTPEDVINYIGTNLVNYPVGCGRIYYFAPAKQEELLANTGVVDVNFGNLKVMKSSFKDRLSMLYDIADAVEYRFYATPKGDIVLEHPMYDYDPWDFFDDVYTLGIHDKTKRTASNINNYEKMFGALYTGNYTSEDIQAISDVVLSLNTDEKILMDPNVNYKFPKFMYHDAFVVGIEEQINFSNTNTDKGLITVCRSDVNLVGNMPWISSEALMDRVYIVNDDLMQMLGFRLHDASLQTYIDDNSVAKYKASLIMNQMNAEARNVGIDCSPKFGLMVNRPLFWRYRNYCANIVSCTHSISWQGDCVSNINVNQIRAWSGKMDAKGQPIYDHFGGASAFNSREVFKSNSTRVKAAN